MTWMLRVLFDYGNLSPEDKSKAIQRMYGFIQNNSYHLNESIATLQKKKGKLMERVKKLI